MRRIRHVEHPAINPLLFIDAPDVRAPIWLIRVQNGLQMRALRHADDGWIVEGQRFRRTGKIRRDGSNLPRTAESQAVRYGIIQADRKHSNHLQTHRMKTPQGVNGCPYPVTV